MSVTAEQLQFLAWAASIFVAVAVSAGSAVLFGSRLFAARDKAIADLAQAVAEVASNAALARKQLEQDMTLKLDAAIGRLEIADQELARGHAAFQIHAGETYATRTGTAEAIGRMEQRVEKAIEALGTDIRETSKAITDRLDKLVDSRRSTRS